MAHRLYAVTKLVATTSAALLLGAVAQAQTQIPAPPYLQVDSQFIIVGVTYDEAVVRKLLPPNIRPTPQFTGGISIYQAPAGNNLPSFSSAYLWVDIEGYDSPDGTKGRMILQGMYGPEPVPTAVRENLGAPVRVGGSRQEPTARGKRGIGVLEGREVISVEIQPGTAPCQSAKGTLHYLNQLGDAKKLAVVEIPYVAEFCGAEAVAVTVQAPDGDPINTLKPTKVLWAGEIKNAAFTLSRPKPVE